LLITHNHSLYPIFKTAAEHWRAQSNLYVATEYDWYRYSPLVAASFVPFSYLPHAAGDIVWRMSSLAIFLGGLSWWAARAESSRFRSARGIGDLAPAAPMWSNRRARALLFLLVMFASLGNLNNGQSNMLVIGLLLIGVTAAMSERWNLAAACVAGAALFKVYPIVIGLLIAALYPRRFAARLALFLVLGVLLPFLMQRPDYVAGQYLAWVEHLRHDTRTGQDVQLWYRDLRIIFRVVLTPLSERTFALLQVAGGALCAGLCLAAHRAHLPARRLLPLLLGLGCCWMMVLGPATESSTYIMLAPTLAWLMVDSWLQRRPLVLRSFYLGVYLLLLSASVVSMFPGGRLLSMVMQPAAGLLLFGGIVLVVLSEIVRARRIAEVPAGAASAESRAA
jgi:hypothetical protein